MFHLSADVRVVHQAGLDLGEAYRTASEEHLWILSLTFGDLLEVGLGIGVGFTFDWWVHKCQVLDHHRVISAVLGLFM